MWRAMAASRRACGLRASSAPTADGINGEVIVGCSLDFACSEGLLQGFLQCFPVEAPGSRLTRLTHALPAFLATFNSGHHLGKRVRGFLQIVRPRPHSVSPCRVLEASVAMEAHYDTT